MNAFHSPSGMYNGRPSTKGLPQCESLSLKDHGSHIARGVKGEGSHFIKQWVVGEKLYCSSGR